jgi:hypothetical protein
LSVLIVVPQNSTANTIQAPNVNVNENAKAIVRSIIRYY